MEIFAFLILLVWFGTAVYATAVCVENRESERNISSWFFSAVGIAALLIWGAVNRVDCCHQDQQQEEVVETTVSCEKK